MRKRFLVRSSGCAALLALGCGADSVNVGDRPDPIGGGDVPDAGGSLVEGGGTRCNIPDLGQYRLLFDSDGGRLERRIYSMRADGTEIEPLTPEGERAREPALSPDGSQLAYVTPEGIWLRDMASGQAELVAPGTSQPAWSHDGTKLFYTGSTTTGVGGSGCLGRMTLSEGTLTQNDACLFRYGSTAPALTPDDSFLVYGQPYTSDGISFSSSILRLDISTGSGMTIVPPTSALIQHATVSTDGVWVATSFQCMGDDAFSLWASPLNVATPACEGRRITPDGMPGARSPEWGPGVLIAYERGEPPRDIAIIAADTGEECVIEGPGDDRNPSWGVLTPSVPE